jgi:hypothetical protein
VTLRIEVQCSRAGLRTSSNLDLSRFVPLRMKRRGVETRIIIAAGDDLPRKVDTALLKAVARSRRWFEELASGSVRSLAEIARRESIAVRYVERLCRLAYTAPGIVEPSAGDGSRLNSTPRRCSTGSICRSNGPRS